MESQRTRRRRSVWLRWLLVFGLLMLLPIPVIETLVPSKGHAGLLSMTQFYPLMMATIYSPFARAPWLTAWGRAQFDEFETAALHRATVAAYATLLGMIVAGLLYLWLASFLGWPMPSTPRTWLGWGLAFGFAGLSLPAAYAEWMVPLPPADLSDDDGELI